MRTNYNYPLKKYSKIYDGKSKKELETIMDKLKKKQWYIYSHYGNNQECQELWKEMQSIEAIIKTQEVQE